MSKESIEKADCCDDKSNESILSQKGIKDKLTS